jgi:hypothetical protein
MPHKWKYQNEMGSFHNTSSGGQALWKSLPKETLIFKKNEFGEKNDENARLDSRYHSTRPYQRLESSGLGEDKRTRRTKCTRCGNNDAAHAT